MSIRFKETYYGKAEMAAACDALKNGTDYIGRVLQKLARIYGTRNIFLTANGSLALDILLLAYDFPKGGEVILPSFTFPSSANSILRMGLVPVFCDIAPETLVMDIGDAAGRITDKTVCVIPTHYGGASCDMDRLEGVFGGIKIIEDAALSIGASYKKRPLGTLGDAAAISFHKTKNVSSEEGGAVIVNDEMMLKKMDLIYENGTDRRAFLRGGVPYYSWQTTGINAGMSNINAAILCEQLDKMDEITQRQLKIYDAYMKHLAPLAEKHGLRLPEIPEYNSNNAHIFYIVFKDATQRDKVKACLAEKSIEAVIHYVPLHLSAMGKKLGYVPEDLPNTMDIFNRMLRLPMHARLSEDDCEAVVRGIGNAL